MRIILNKYDNTTNHYNFKSKTYLINLIIKMHLIVEEIIDQLR